MTAIQARVHSICVLLVGLDFMDEGCLNSDPREWTVAQIYKTRAPSGHLNGIRCGLRVGINQHSSMGPGYSVYGTS